MLYESATLGVESHYGIATLRFRSGAHWGTVVRDFHASLDCLDHPAYDVLVIREFAALPTGSAADCRSLRTRLSNWPIPTIAFLTEPCRGSALDLTLACSWRTIAGTEWHPAFIDRAWATHVAEVQLMSLEQSLQHRPRRPNRLVRWWRDRNAA